MLPGRPVLLNVGVVLCLGTLSSTYACSPEEVQVESPALDVADASMCRKLLDALPQTVSGQTRRDLETESGYAAAWGDPAIVLRCGVGVPEGFDEFSACQVTNGVGWFIPEDQITGEATEIWMTTVDRTPAVEVRLPPEYFPPAATMVDLAPAITQSIQQDDPCL